MPGPGQIDCGNNHLTFEQVFSSCLTKTEEGDLAIRVMLVEACEEDAINCSKNALPLDTLLKSTIGNSDECAKPALRLGLTKTAILSAIGVESYANNAAAVTGGLLVNQVYYNTSTEQLTIVTA